MGAPPSHEGPPTFEAEPSALEVALPLEIQRLGPSRRFLVDCLGGLSALCVLAFEVGAVDHFFAWAVMCRHSFFISGLLIIG